MSMNDDRAEEQLGTIILEEERLQEDFSRIPNTILRRQDVSPGAKLAYVMLLSYAHQKDRCFPGQDTLATDMGVSRRSIVSYLQELQKTGLLRVHRRGLGRTNIYTLAKWIQPRSAKFAPQEVQARSAESASPEVSNLHDTKQKEGRIKEQQHVVVEELTKRGITRAVARDLAAAFSAEVIQSQVEVFDWLKEDHPKRLGKNPAGFLRKAIEQDYQPPPDYRNPQQRQAEQEQKQRDLELEQAERQAEEEQREREREAVRQALSKEHPPQQIDGTELTTETAWQMALERLKTTMTLGNYHTWLSDTRLITCDRSRALIVAPSPFVAEHLGLRFNVLVRKELSSVVGFFPERIDYLAATDLRSDASSSKQAAATSLP